MNQSLLLWGALALTLFWSVGLFNRMMRMRSRSLLAYKSLETSVRKFSELAGELGLTSQDTHMAKSHGGSIESAARWKMLNEALTAADNALDRAAPAPLTEASLADFGARLRGVQVAWSVLRNAPADLAGPILPEAMRRRWAILSDQVDSQRLVLDLALENYNAALEQFPANLVVGWLGFKPAGQLGRADVGP